jgi:hypothetical protein
MANTPSAPMITQEQAVACLQILGIEAHAPTPDKLPRAQALGHLLFLIEASTLADVDRLDQESLRVGYAAAANMVVTGSMGIEGDADTLITLHLLGRLVEDRLRRTRLDLADLDTPVEDGTGWSPTAAIDAMLNSMLALVGHGVPPFVFDGSSQVEVEAMRNAIKTAEVGIHAALSQLGDGLQTAGRLAQD